MNLIYLYQAHYMCKKGNYYIKMSFFYSNISPFEIDNAFSFDIYDNPYLR